MFCVTKNKHQLIHNLYSQVKSPYNMTFLAIIILSGRAMGFFVSLKINLCSVHLISVLDRAATIHTQNTASAPSHPIQHPTAGMGTHMTPVGCVMAGCCQINYILTNIGRRNSIRILNQHPCSEIYQYEQSLFVLSIFLHFKN